VPGHASGVHDFGDQVRSKQRIAETDQLFAYFTRGLTLVLVLYGAGMMACVLFGDAALASKLINGFTTMFAALVGLGSGYVLGRARDSKETQ
jgi:hypothetical protein